MKRIWAFWVGGAISVGMAAWLVGTKLPRWATANRETLPAPKDLKAFVEKNQNAKDSKTQDMVGAARVRLAYGSAKTGDFASARSALLAEAKEYRGSGAMSPEFGTIPDQAAYQAAVCLVAEGKKPEATKEFERFIKERPLSPLTFACHKRLVKMNGGQSKPEWDRLLQTAVAAQEKRARFEASVCGPRAVERVLPLLGKPKRSYKEIASLCGTTDKGTTIEGLRKGLKSLGVASYAFRLNRKDLATAPTPAIALEGDHYLVFLSVRGDSVKVYDPRFSREEDRKLPPMGDPDFSADLILFSQPKTGQP